tara:strand:- start:422 stop:577 length:156 start_codon:yes stop_codon:yes gene_type:complete
MKCTRCKIEMVEGEAIKNTIVSTDEGTKSRTGKAVKVKVLKCPQCGKSIEK